MKKFYSLVFATVFAIGFTSAQCTIDSANTVFFVPNVNNVPCAEQGVAYDEVLQFHIPVSIDAQNYGSPISYVITVDSLVLDSISGLPAGLSWSSNGPGPVFHGGENGCGRTFGTTNAPAGNYVIHFNGRFRAHGNAIPGVFNGKIDTTIDGLIKIEEGKLFSVDVIAPGSVCGGTGINSFNGELNAAMFVFPNPSNGLFELRLNAGQRVNGDINVIDVIGRLVYTEKLDVIGQYTTSIDLTRFSKGLYTVQLKTTEGIATRNISVE